MNDELNPLAVYRIRDPRLERIRERLARLVGPGPAGHFRDACRAMAEPDRFLSTTNLVSHLLREIEDALRDVLAPMAGTSTNGATESRRALLEGILATEGVSFATTLAHSLGALVEVRNPRNLRPGHKEEVRAIVSALSLEKSAIVDAWLRFAGGDYSLPRFAHRRNFDAARPVDAGFVKLWEDMVGVLDATLARFEERYDSVFQTLATLRALPAPTSADVQTLVANVPSSLAARQFFFEGLANPAWLPLLRKKGFFRSPPPPIVDPDGKSISFLSWPESRYLVRMASIPKAQGVVGEIFDAMEDTENVRVVGDVLEALNALPLEVGQKSRERVLSWVERQPQLFHLIPQGLEALALHAADCGDQATAHRILRALLVLAQPGPGHYGGPCARVETWDYLRVLREVVPRIVGLENDGARFAFLLDLLEQSGLSGVPSLYWRSSIENSDQIHHDGAANELITQLRDTAHRLVTQDPASIGSIVDRLGAGDAQRSLKRRLALNLLRTAPTPDRDRIATALLDADLLLDLDVHHEYRTLLRDRFAVLPAEVQERLLELLERGTTVDWWKAERERKGEPPLTPEEERMYRDRAVREDFALIAEHLTGERVARYRRIVEEFGEAQHPEYLIYTEAFSGFVGSKSPLSRENLRALSIPDLRRYLDSWVPTGSFFEGPSHEGLAEMLTQLVAEAPATYGAALDTLHCTEPTYVRGILRGFTNAVGAGTAGPWESLLAYCTWALAQGGSETPKGRESWGRDPDWAWTRRAILDLLQAGFKTGETQIPLALRAAAWAVLLPLLTDPTSPTVETETTGSDLVTTAMNSTRGQALERVVEYAFWLRERGGDDGLTFDAMPEVRNALDARLDPVTEPSAAIRSVFGFHLVQLFILDRGWLGDAKWRIFPDDPAAAALRRAAWSAYLNFSRAFDEVYRLLSDVYDRAVRGLEEGDAADVATWPKLGEHLAALYWRGVVTLEPGSLLDRFFAAAPDDVRAHAVELLGRALRDREQPVPVPVRERLEQLWVARLATIKAGAVASERELRAFTWWFALSAFPSPSAAEQLLETADLRGGLAADLWLVEALAEQASSIPSLALRILRAVTLGQSDAMQFSCESGPIHRILAAGDASGHDTDRTLVSEIVGRLAAKGCTEFLDVRPRPRGA